MSTHQASLQLTPGNRPSVVTQQQDFWTRVAAAAAWRGLSVSMRLLGPGAEVVLISRQSVVRTSAAASKPSGSMGAIHEAAVRGDTEQLVRLLQSDASQVCARDEDGCGCTPLHDACEFGHMEVAKVLLDFGANVNAIHSWGTSPLLLACLRGRAALVTMLLSRGADPTLRNAGYFQALIAAAFGGDAETVRLVLRDGRCRVNDRSGLGQTALWWACRYGHVDAARVLLLEGGADHTLAGEGCTPMHTAVEYGHTACIELLEWYENELERAYVLSKARQIEDDTEAVRQAPVKAEAQSTQGVRRARMEVAPAYLRRRVKKREPLPYIETAVPREEKEEAAVEECSREEYHGCKRGRDDETRRGVVQQVVMVMKEDLFKELIGFIRLRR